MARRSPISVGTSFFPLTWCLWVDSQPTRSIESNRILFAKRKERDRFRWNVAATTIARDAWNGHRAAIGSGLLLICAGIVIYLPMGAMSGRYVMPGIWGLDILIGIVLSHFILIPGSLPKRAAWAALSIGMIAVASANIGKQETQIARTRMLWDALEWVEGNVPRDTTIGWFGGIDPQSTLSAEEGVHFAWHLRARSKAHVRVILFDERGIPWDRVEIQDRSDVLDLRIVGMARASRDSSWQEQSRFIETYWAGWKKHECVVERPGRDAPVTALDNRHVSAGR